MCTSNMKYSICSLTLGLLLVLGSTQEIKGGTDRAGAGKDDILLSAMQLELQRAGLELGN